MRPATDWGVKERQTRLRLRRVWRNRWRCRESNPGPKQTAGSIYKRSCGFVFAQAVQQQPPSTSLASRWSWARLSASTGRTLRFMTMHPDAVRLHQRHRPSPKRGVLFLNPYAARATELLCATGKRNDLPDLAFVFLLWISEVRAPRLAAYDPICPVETVHPH